MDDKKQKLTNNTNSLSLNKLISAGNPFLKNQAQIEVHRFRLMPTDMLKNTQWDQKKPPRLEKVNHGHWFYTRDKRGQEMTRCHLVGGHAHEVRVFWKQNKEGVMVVERVEVGPAMRFGTKTLKTGKKIKALMPIMWLDDSNVNSEHDEAREIIDNHTHDVSYIGMDIVQLHTQHRDFGGHAPTINPNSGISVKDA